MDKRYDVVIAESGKIDIIKKKKYILESFKYRDYAENYSSKIRKAAKELETFPYAYQTSGFLYRGYEIYYYPGIYYSLQLMNRLERLQFFVCYKMGWIGKEL